MGEFMTPDRSTPEYIEAVISKKPHAEDPKDIRIRNLIEESFLQEQWARDTFANIRDEQITYLRDVVSHVDDPAYVDAATQDALGAISAELRSTVEEGQENLAKVPLSSPVLIIWLMCTPIV
jgi:hypothetical protein